MTRPTAGVRSLTSADFDRARRTLMRRDPRLGAVIRRVGARRPAAVDHPDPYIALVRAIISQQLSTTAANTIHGRVVALVGGLPSLGAASLLAVDPTALRVAGLSRQKTAYLRDLAERVQDGRLDLHALEQLPDEDVITALTSVKGLGRWSAEMYLIFRLRRPDVFPAGDLGIVKGVQKLLGMKRRPAPRTMMRLAEAWRPYRSVAAWYLWRIHE